MSDFETNPRLAQLWPLIRQAAHTVQRLRRTAEFLECCEEALRSPSRQLRYNVFHEISGFLGRGVSCDAEIWNWLQETARSADPERREDMRIGVFELVPDPPIRWADLFRLWDMWFDPQARWAVYSAYHPFPGRVMLHFRRYRAHRKRHRLVIPEFSLEEFNSCLKHAGRSDFKQETVCRP